MKIAKVVFVAAVLVFACGSAKDADAKAYFSFGYYGPGITFYGGHHPRYYPYGYYYPYYYGYRPYRYRPRYRYRRHRHRRYGGRCGYWSGRCADNWGYGGADYRGCLKYHGCY